MIYLRFNYFYKQKKVNLIEFQFANCQILSMHQINISEKFSSDHEHLNHATTTRRRHEQFCRSHETTFILVQGQWVSNLKSVPTSNLESLDAIIYPEQQQFTPISFGIKQGDSRLILIAKPVRMFKIYDKACTMQSYDIV